MNWRNTKEYRVWKIEVIRRDRVCQACGSMKNRVAHHINSGSYHPYIRYDVNNGICLCSGCHKRLHCDFKSSYRVKTTGNDLYNFLNIVFDYHELFRG